MPAIAVPIADRVEGARQREPAADVVGKQLHGARERTAGLVPALGGEQQAPEVVPGTPRLRIGFDAPPQPLHCRLTVAVVEGEARLVRVRPRERGGQAHAFVEQSRRALDVADAEVALRGDHEERLRALADRPRAFRR